MRADTHSLQIRDETRKKKGTRCCIFYHLSCDFTWSADTRLISVFLHPTALSACRLFKMHFLPPRPLPLLVIVKFPFLTPHTHESKRYSSSSSVTDTGPDSSILSDCVSVVRCYETKWQHLGFICLSIFGNTLQDSQGIICMHFHWEYCRSTVPSLSCQILYQIRKRRLKW